MKGFKRLLLLVKQTSDDRALIKQAAAIAAVSHAQVTVLHVIDQLPENKHLQEANPTLDVKSVLVEALTKRLQTETQALVDAGAQVNIVIKEGTPWLETIYEVMRHPQDLVLVTAEHKPWFRQMIFGSNTLNLIRKCPAPVWALQSKRPAKLKRILAAVDPDPNDVTRDSLNREILRVAIALAKFSKCELHIVHAWRLAGESTLQGGFVNLPENSMQTLLHETEVQQQRAMTQLLSDQDLTGVEYQMHFVKGEASQVIPKIARKKRISVIVMGTVCRQGVKGFFIGNTAEDILSQVKCAVLTLKPAGFVTPVDQE